MQYHGQYITVMCTLTFSNLLQTFLPIALMIFRNINICCDLQSIYLEDENSNDDLRQSLNDDIDNIMLILENIY